MFKDHFNNAPLKAIISLFKVNFDYHVPFLLFREYINSWAITTLSEALLPSKKAAYMGDIKDGRRCLSLRTMIFKMTLYINRIAKAYRSVVANIFKSKLFWNKSNKGLIEVF